MRMLIYTLMFSALLAGCALTTLTTKDEVSHPAPEPVPADEHLGDPTFTEETTEKPAEATVDKPTDENAVVDRNDSAPRLKPVVDADLERGVALYNEGSLREARLALTAALNKELSEEDEAFTLATLREINSSLFLSTGPGGDLRVYTVKSGDTLGKIATNTGTTWEMIQRLNGLKTTRIDVGQELKILGGTFELVVRKEKFVMDLMLDGAFIQRYEVGLGVGGCTPLGEFVVKNRIPKPADGSYPYGHAKHRLGSRWLGLQNDEGYKGYGIHGCRPEEESEIGTECSQGCVRMTNADVEEIYDIVPAGTRVVIQPR
jgi:LysM repeat protein